jgi:uncharacterized protein
LDRTFSSAVDVAAGRFFFLPIRQVMRNQFPSISRIETYRGPLLQMHGTVDEVIPFAMGRKLFDACPSTAKEFQRVDGLYHNDPWPDEFWRGGQSFIESLSAR